MTPLLTHLNCSNIIKPLKCGTLHKCGSLFVVFYCVLVLINLTQWGRITHLCVSKLSIIGSDNGLSPGRRQAIIWTSAGILLIGTRGTNFNEISIKIHEFSFKKIHLEMSSGKWRPSCLGLNVLTISFRFTSLPSGQPYRCLSASE